MRTLEEMLAAVLADEGGMAIFTDSERVASFHDVTDHMASAVRAWLVDLLEDETTIKAAARALHAWNEEEILERWDWESLAPASRGLLEDGARAVLGVVVQVINKETRSEC